MVSNTLNASTSKEMHAFSKASRFPTIESNTRHASIGSYDKKTDFDRTVRKGTGKTEHSFGSRHRRFSYYAGAKDS